MAPTAQTDRKGTPRLCRSRAERPFPVWRVRSRKIGKWLQRSLCFRNAYRKYRLCRARLSRFLPHRARERDGIGFLCRKIPIQRCFRYNRRISISVFPDVPKSRHHGRRTEPLRQWYRRNRRRYRMRICICHIFLRNHKRSKRCDRCREDVF